MEKRSLGEHVVEWASRVGGRLDDLPDEERREVLRLLLDEVTIDGENNVSLTLGIPTEELASIGTPVSGPTAPTTTIRRVSFDALQGVPRSFSCRCHAGGLRAR